MIYGDAAGFVTYHESRGRTIPITWDDAYISAALLVASEWIDATYGPSFIGYKTDGFEQEREWPRIAAIVDSIPRFVIEDDQIPDRIAKATYEAAFREATIAGSLVKDFTPGKYTSVKIEGALSVDYRQFNYASEIQTQINQVESWLAPLIDVSSGASESSLSGPGIRS